MQFDSFQYIAFLTAITVIYYVLPHKIRWLFLLSASVFFYMCFGPVMLYVPLAIIIISYLCGISLGKSGNGGYKKILFISGIVLITGILVFYKYFNFLNENITELLGLINVRNRIPYLKLLAPLGISYITFQAIGYLIEIYLGRHKPEKKLFSFATYLMFFPKLIAGPVERAHDFLPQLSVRHYFDYDNVTDGLRLLAWGLFQKTVVADRLAVIVNQVFDRPYDCPGASLLIATVLFTFQVYADFSGYTDMALGSASLLGFKLMKNFDNPFISRSTTELWRRWHISLSTWFSDYVFKPISVQTREWGVWGLIFASMATFSMLGLWHGARWGFVIFGLLQGTALSLELLTNGVRKKIAKRTPAFINNCSGVIYTFFLFSVGLIFIRANSVSDALYIITHLTSGIPHTFSHWVSISSNLKIVFDKSEWIAAISGLFFMEVIHLLQTRYGILLKATPAPIRWVVYFTVVYSILIFGFFQSTPFIYFKF